MTFTAKVAGQFGGAAAGSVSFFNGTTLLGSGTLARGLATFTTATLAVGTDSITADYAGDANNTKSNSAVLNQVVDLATKTVLTSSANPSTFGENVTFTATVTASGATPVGMVTFENGTTVLGTVNLSNGVATFSTNALAVGKSTIKALYSGATGFKASSATLTQTVNQETTTTALTSSANPSTVGESVTFTATVQAASGTPAGVVTFDNGTVVLGTVNLTNGVAQFTTSTLTAGSHTIKVTYSGNADFKTSSAELVQTVH